MRIYRVKPLSKMNQVLFLFITECDGDGHRFFARRSPLIKQAETRREEMPEKKLTKIAAVLIISAMLFIWLDLSACSAGQKSNTSLIDVEAQQQAENFWFGQITKCGTDYYRQAEIKNAGSEFYQIKEPMVRLAPWKVDDADRLNGIEWHGMIALEAKATRGWDSGLGHWETWSNGAGRLSDHEYPMQKVNGQWSVNTKKGGVFDEVIHYVPVDCSKIPQ
jgi:hypothetical protein